MFADSDALDVFAVRTWAGEAYNAIFSSPHFSPHRKAARERLTQGLVDAFRIFCPGERLKWFSHNFESQCVVPAMQLYEKLQVATHHFYFDITPYIIWGRGGQLEPSPELMDNLGSLDMRDLIRNR